MSESPHDQRANARQFGGVDRASDPHDVPPGTWVDARNLMTDNTGQEQRTRDGYTLVVNKLFAEPFAILPGAAGGRLNGGLVGIPTTDPTPSYGDGTLRLIASPATPPAQVVPVDITFAVYGGAELGIATYDWDFDVNAGGGSDTSGSATSVINNYTTAGNKLVRVWGTGADALVYEAFCTVVLIAALGDTLPPDEFPPPPPPPPPPDPDPDPDNPPTLDVWAVEETIYEGEFSDLHYQTTNANLVTMDGVPLGAVNGIETVQPTETTWYIFDAFGTGGAVTMQVKVTVIEEPPPAGYLKCDDAPYVMIHSEAKDCEVYAYADGQANVKANYPSLPPTEPLPVLSQISSLYGTTIAQTGPTIAAADASPAIWSLTATLPVGVDYDEITIYVEIPGFPEIVPAEFKLAVVRELETLTVSVVDQYGIDLPSIDGFISASTCTGEAYLSMYNDDGGPDLAYASDTKITIVHQDGDPESPTFTVVDTGDAAIWVASTKISTSDNIINAGAFSGGTAGYASCKFNLQMEAYDALNEAGNDAWVRVQFVATRNVDLSGLI